MSGVSGCYEKLAKGKFQMNQYKMHGRPIVSHYSLVLLCINEYPKQSQDFKIPAEIAAMVYEVPVSGGQLGSKNCKLMYQISNGE